MIIPIDPARPESLRVWCDVWATVRAVGARAPHELAAEIDLDARTALWLVLDQDGRPVGAVRLTDSRWTGPDDPAELMLALFPAHGRALGRVLDTAADHARAWGEQALSVACRDVRADLPLRTLLLDRGYGCIERDVESVLAVDEALDVTPDPPVGVTITSLADRPDLAESAHRCFELADADEPSAGAGCSRAFDQWCREYASPWCTPHDCLIAVADGVVVGWAHLERFSREPAAGWNGFTGTHPEHRGRGIAGALKGRLLKRARVLGLTHLRTENVEGNLSMRRINARMGYVPSHVNEWWRTSLTG